MKMEPYVIHAIAEEISRINSKQPTPKLGAMDSQRAAGQGDAKAHYRTHRAPYGRPQAPIGGAWGCGFCCVFASPWPAARCESMRYFRSWLCGWSWFWAILR